MEPFKDFLASATGGGGPVRSAMDKATRFGANLNDPDSIFLDAMESANGPYGGGDAADEYEGKVA